MFENLMLDKPRGFPLRLEELQDVKALQECHSCNLGKMLGMELNPEWVKIVEKEQS